MKSTEIEEKLIPLIAEAFSIARDQIKANAKLADDLGADSLDTAELIMAINEKFGYEMQEEDIANISTVKDIITLLESKVSDVA